MKVEKTLKKGVKKEEVDIEEEADTLDLENAELFPSTPLREFLETKQTSRIPLGVSQEFYKLYTEVINKTQKTTPLHELPKHGRLNNLIYHIKTREDALLLPETVVQWREKLLPSTPITARFIIKKCCEVNSEDVAFQMLTTFGLMTYYDVSQYDAHLYTVLISASLKLEDWERVDITASEFLEHLDEMNDESLELPPIPSDWEKKELKKHQDKFPEYSVESRINRLNSCIDMANILEIWYTESKPDIKKAESFGKLKENWNNTIEKLMKLEIDDSSL